MTAAADDQDAPDRGRPRKPNTMAALLLGAHRVVRAPALVAGVWLTTVLVAVPLALALRGTLAAHLGTSLAAQAAADGVNFDWWNEFLAQSSGLGRSFVPRIIGFAAVLGNLSRLADAIWPDPYVAGAIGAYLLLSVFFSGGILDRLARNRVVGAPAFFAACGVFFFRFLRLGVIAGIAYAWLFGVLHPWLFDAVYPALTHDLTVERTAALYRSGLYLAFGLCVALVNVTMDYAKVRAVVEDRRSMLMTLAAAARFIARNAGAVASLYVLNLIVFLVLLLIYSDAAPGVAGGWRLWMGLLTGQAFILLRGALRLLFAASEITLFQSRLAHAGYTATPVPTWPDSPDIEAMQAVHSSQ